MYAAAHPSRGVRTGHAVARCEPADVVGVAEVSAKSIAPRRRSPLPVADSAAIVWGRPETRVGSDAATSCEPSTGRICGGQAEPLLASASGVSRRRPTSCSGSQPRRGYASPTPKAAELTARTATLTTGATRVSSDPRGGRGQAPFRSQLSVSSASLELRRSRRQEARHVR